LLNNGTHAANSDFALRQAYVLLRVPYENGIDLKVGVFDSILGYESIESGANPNFTRSYGHGIEPQTHTGMLASYHFTELFSVSAGVANTTGPAINDRTFAPYGTYAESYKTYMGSFSLTAPESFGTLAGSTLYGGVVNGFSSRTIVTDPTTGATVQASQTSYYVGATVATPITGVRCGVAFDDLDVHSDVSGETWAVAGYVTWQATEKLSFHGRAEYLRDRGQQKVYVMQIADPTGAAPPVASQLSPDEVFSWTATMQYDLWKNVLSRVELRWDHACSGGGIYGGSGNSFTNPNTGTEKNAVMLAANIIYKF
jgi:hypothetical protein